MDLVVVTINEHDGILHAKMSGAASLRNAQRLWEQILDTCAEHKLCKVLVDFHGVIGTLTTRELYDIASMCAHYLAELGINPWIAIVGTPPTVDGFATTVANNRGARVQNFGDSESALRWLRATGQAAGR